MRCIVLFFLTLLCSSIVGASLVRASQSTSANDEPLTPATVIARSQPADWRRLDPENTVYLKLASGTVIFELAPNFAPRHIANLKTLIASKYFDELAVIRVQDNYVVQWGDPNAGTEKAKPLGKAKVKIAGEYYRPAAGLDLTPIESRDAYAPDVGFVGGFAAGNDGTRAWLTHCYGALGAGRAMEPDSGNAAELYVVTGHAPRHLDRNVTLLGRALVGMELLSSLPRGTGTLGFYEDPADAVPIISIRLGSDLPPEQRSTIEVMRTDTELFSAYVYSRTHRKNEWFLDAAGNIDICNVGVPIRETQTTSD